MLMHEKLTEAIIGAAIEVHRELGPGPAHDAPSIERKKNWIDHQFECRAFEGWNRSASALTNSKLRVLRGSVVNRDLQGT
jgi:hypothetical protein